MRNNLKIILLCAVMLLVVLILWLGTKEKESRPPLEAEISNTNAALGQNAAKPAADQQDGSISTNARTTLATPVSQRTNSLTSEEKIRAAVESENVQINFWGLVEDQDGNPLEGVKITGNTRTWYVTSTLNFDSRFPTVNAVSDSNGKFEIRNASGDVLTIKSMEKEGYEPEPGALRGFGYHTSERFSADQNNPIVFKMWKTNIHEQLIIGKKRSHIVPDGRTYWINFAKGTITESGEGDIKVWIKYPEQVIHGQTYDWSCEMDIMNGGFVEETDPYSSMFFAPVNGYAGTFQYPQQIKGGQSGSTGTKRFYIMLNNGQEYGRIIIELMAPYNDQIPGMIDIQYAINPSGSRILR